MKAALGSGSGDEEGRLRIRPSGRDRARPAEPARRADEGGKLLVSKMSQDQKAALRKLQDYERLVAAKSFKMQEEVLTPVEEKIQEELFSGKCNRPIWMYTPVLPQIGGYE